MNKENKIRITTAKGRPMLNWVGKKPLDYVKGFPTQLVEVFNPLNTERIIDIPTYKELEDNWQNLLFHGDNKDVLATLLELGFRGKIDLIYIDPPFKSGADYVRKIELRGLKKLGRIEEDEASVLQQTMYFDIWNNDTYLQFMYERLILMKELLADKGNFFIHLNHEFGHYIKLILDEIFGGENFINEIIWIYSQASSPNIKTLNPTHQVIYWYSKNKGYTFNPDEIRLEYSEASKKMVGRRKAFHHGGKFVIELKEEGKFPDDWIYIPTGIAMAKEHLGFATQKPEKLLEFIVKGFSNLNDLVLDCFIGSGTTVRVAQNLGRRWIGCDINKGCIHLTNRELQKIINEQTENAEAKYPTFATYKVNNYDLKLLRTEAIELAVKHIGIQRTRTDRFFDGYLGKNLVKIIDFNHPLILLDLQLLQDELKKRPSEDRDITIVCLGKELAVDPWIEEWNKKHPINKIRVIELKTDKKYGNFLIHKPAEAKIKIQRKSKNKTFIEIEDFISPTIIERLNIDSKLFKVKIPDFRCMIDTVLIDTNYNGNIFNIIYADVPKKKTDLVEGKYELEILQDKTTVAVKIIDMLGEEVIYTKEI